MIDSNNYIPILKWKRAEQRALKELSDERKKNMTPLIQLVMPRPKAAREGEPKKSYEQQYEGVVTNFKEKIIEIPESIQNSWGKTAAFLDETLIYTNSLKEESFTRILSKSEELGLSLIPVLNLSDDSEVKELIWSQARKYGHGLCLRLVGADLNNMDDLSTKLNNFLTESTLNEKDVDLLIDIQEIFDNNNKYAFFTNLSQKIYNLVKWRTFTFASGAFPIDLTNYKIDEENLIPRLDWKSWSNQIKNKNLLRPPTFADYTIQHPIYKESVQFFPPSTSIRYTLSDDWLILKGKKHRYKYYLANAKILSDDERFFGAEFSFGDDYIFKKGNHYDDYIKNEKLKGTGTAETWLTAGINHHLVCTVDQISNLL